MLGDIKRLLLADDDFEERSRFDRERDRDRDFCER